MRSSILALCTLALCSVCAHAASSPVWLKIDTPHFTVISDAGEKQTRHVAGQFERMQAVFHKILPGAKSDSGSPIVVLAVKNGREFQTLVPAAYLKRGSLDLAGMFLQSSDRNYILVRLDAEGEHPYSTVYHEYTHYVTRDAHIPVWLNEGIAEFYQNTDIDAREIRFGQPSGNDLQLLRSQRLVPLPTLFDVDQNSPYYHDEEKGTIFYAESWALTYMLYLNDFNNKTTLLPNYLKALSSGQTSLTAAVTAFGDLKKLQGGLNSLIGQSSFHYLTLAIAIPNDEATYKVTAIATTDADAYRAAVLVADGRSEDAQKLIDAVLAVNPDSAVAYESEGMLHLRDHDLDAARKAYTEAIARHSTSFLAWYNAAVLTQRYGNHDDSSVETKLQECLKLNPNFAPANNALSGYYASVHKNLDEALSLSILAVTQEPENFHYRLNNANLHMEREEIPAALSVLEAARPYATNPSEVAELNARIGGVHRYQEQLAARSAPSVTVTTVSTVKTVTAAPADDDPHYPDMQPTGARHIASGVLHNVQCSYPTILTLTVDGGSKTIALYTNHMYKIDYWVNFSPKGGLNPCKIEGMKAAVTYTDVKDPRVAGQIVAIKITK